MAFLGCLWLGAFAVGIPGVLTAIYLVVVRNKKPPRGFDVEPSKGSQFVQVDPPKDRQP